MQRINKRMTTFMLAVVLLLAMSIPTSAQSTRVNRLIVSQLLNVVGTTTLTGAVTTGGRVGIGSTIGMTPATGIVVTMNATITPLGSYQPISSAGTVNTSSITVGTAGDILLLENTSATTIVFTDTGTLKLTGNISLGQFDTLQLVSDGTNWLMTSTANN